MMLSLKKLFMLVTTIALAVCETPKETRITLKPSGDNILIETSIIYGVLVNAAQEEEGQCALEARNFIKAVETHEIWAIKAIDASGQISSSFVWGNIRWLGKKENCLYLNEAPFIYESRLNKAQRDPELISSISPFRFDYKMVFANFTSRMFIDSLTYAKPMLQIGLCVPSSCDDNQLKKYADKYFKNKSFAAQKLLELDVNVKTVRGTSIDLFLSNPQVARILYGIIAMFMTTAIFSQISSKLKISASSTEKELPISQRFFQCFSLSRNYKSLFHSKPKSDSLASINAIRIFICLLNFGLHIAYYGCFAFDSFSTGLLLFYDTAIGQPFLNGALWTDGFFAISGLLLVYSYLKDANKMQQIRDASVIDNFKALLKLTIHRYIRLMPILVFVMAIMQLVGIYVRDASTSYIDEDYDFLCTRSNFIRNIFLYQNFYSVSNTCVSWAWYIACDIQYFIVFVILIMTYAKKKWVACFIILTFSIINPIWSFRQYQPHFRIGIDTMRVSHSHFYSRPYYRVSPYIVGAFFGWLLCRLRKTTFKFNKYVAALLWIFSTISLSMYTYTTYQPMYRNRAAKKAVNYDRSKDPFALVIVRLGILLVKPLFALSICLIILLCFVGNGNRLKKICSQKMFVHFGKITYSIYLIHPVIVVWMFGARDVATSFDYMLIFNYFGLVVFSYIVAVISTLFIEIPFTNLSEEFIMKPKRITKNDLNGGSTNNKLNGRSTLNGVNGGSNINGLNSGGSVNGSNGSSTLNVGQKINLKKDS